MKRFLFTLLFCAPLMGAPVIQMDATVASPSLTLLRNTQLAGPVAITNPVALTVGSDLNLLFSMTGNSGGFRSVSSALPFAVNGNTVATVDPKGLGMQPDMLQDIADSVLNNIYQNRVALLTCCPLRGGWWAGGFGSTRWRDDTANYRNSQGGYLTGRNFVFRDAHTLGFFSGGSFGKGRLNNGTQNTVMDAWFYGMSYEGLYSYGLFGFSGILGYVDFVNRREVSNNLTPTGRLWNHASTTGLIYCPEVSYTLPIKKMKRFGVVGHGIVRYAGLWLGNYTEKRTVESFSVRDHNVGLVKVRGDLSFPIDIRRWCQTFISPYIGVAGRFQVLGEQADISLLNQALTVDTGSPENLVEFLIGIQTEQSYHDAKLYANIQGLFDSENSQRLLGQLGIRF